jgi:hypothetical protein
MTSCITSGRKTRPTPWGGESAVVGPENDLQKTLQMVIDIRTIADLRIGLVEKRLKIKKALIRIIIGRGNIDQMIQHLLVAGSRAGNTGAVALRSVLPEGERVLQDRVFKGGLLGDDGERIILALIVLFEQFQKRGSAGKDEPLKVPEFLAAVGLSDMGQEGREPGIIRIGHQRRDKGDGRVHIAGIVAAVEQGRHSALAGPGADPSSGEKTSQGLPGAMLVAGRLADGQVSPIGRDGVGKEAMDQKDLIGLEESG